MNKAVIKLMFGASDYSVLPRAFEQLKAWTQARKLAKQWAAYCLRAMRHPLFWHFRKWKN